LEVKIEHSKLTTEMHPVKQKKNTFSLALKLDKEKESEFARIKEFNIIIGDENKLIKEWDLFLNKRFKSYLSEWSPISFIKNKLIYKIFNKLKIYCLNKEGIAVNLSLIQCEAHLDASLAILKKHLNKHDK
jgi:poly-gamma-glutamate synthesis protein (capsule biosynthesis protein)